MEAKFNLRQVKDENRLTPINLVCTINRKQEKFSTGQRIRPKHWEKDKQLAIVSNVLPKAIQLQNKKVNDALDTIKAKFDEWHYYMLEHPEEQDRASDKLRVFLKDERARLEIEPMEWFEEFVRNDNTTSAGTKKKYLADLKTLKEFIEEKKVRANEFGDVNFTFLTRYEEYLAEKGRKIATIINKKRSLLAWIHEAERQGITNTIETGVSRYRIPKNKESDNQVYLTEDEIECLLELELTGNEEAIRDIFVLQCQLGQRYGDMMKLDEAVITDKSITLIQEKTAKRVIIPLNAIAKNILAKHNNKLPQISIEFGNQLLKDIGRKAQINDEVLVSNQRGRKLENKKVPKYELISTHTARRTFITNALKNNISHSVIMRVTGHSSFKTMEGYNKMTADDVRMSLLSEIDKDEERIDKKVKSKVKKFTDEVSKKEEDRQTNLLREMIYDGYTYEQMETIYRTGFEADFSVKQSIPRTKEELDAIDKPIGEDLFI